MGFTRRVFPRPNLFLTGFPPLRHCSKALLFIFFSMHGAATTRAADDPAVLLKRNFESAKSALASGDLAEAERRYHQTIAVGLRQVGNISVSESRFDEATRELDQALKFAPADPEIAVEAAIAWFRAGDLQKARQLAQAVVAAHPRQARAQDVLGRIELYRGDFPAAIRALQASIALNEDFETSYFLGLAYLKAKRLTDAQQWFQHIQSTLEDSAALHVLFGRAYSICHFPEPAVAEFRKAVQLDPKYPRAHELLGYSLLEFRGEEAYPQARLEFERELKLHPGEYNALLLLGISDVALRDFPAAEAALLHASRLRPSEPFAYLYLGEIYSGTNRLPQAVEALEKYIHLVPDPEEIPRDVSRAYYLLGQTLRRLGRLDEAQKALVNSQRYREAKFRYDAKHIFDEPAAPSDGDSHTSDRIAGLLESGANDQQKSTKAMVQGGVQENPSAQRPPVPAQAVESNAAKEYRSFVSQILASSYNDLGVMRAKALNFADAAEFFKQAGAWNPALAGLDRNWGLAAYRAELYAEAVPPLERQLAAHSDDHLVRQLLGISYYVTENFSKTVEVLRPFLKAPPDDPALLFAWGTALVRTRQPDLAMEMFQRLLQQNAGNPSVHLLLGQAHAQQKDYPHALTELNTALQLDPRLPEAHYYRGLVYLHQSAFEPAAQEFRAELQLRPADPLSTYHLGYALLAQGHPEDAVPLFRDVIKALPTYESAYFELGRALLQQGDTAGAIESLETARKLVPDHDATYFQLSQAYRRAGRTQEAQQSLAAFQKIIEENRLKKRESLEMEKP
ncbi:MAG TPA: tetratricopeptide repeat protein [Candidatus Acidoferrum sp.]|nr:tetratricopeptide repeat protein [Candidatus Acidoferrum sp.]